MAELSTPEFKESEKYDHRKWARKNRYLRKIGLEIEPNVNIDSGFEFVRNSGIKMGEWTAIGKNTKFYNFNDISIGRFYMFAGELQISNGSHKTDSFTPYSGFLKIGNGVWIGHGVKIVGTDIEIGDNSVIGAGALIIKSVDPNSIMVGVPAKKIGVRLPSEKVWHIGDVWFSPDRFNQVQEW